VHKVQDGYRVTLLADWGKPPRHTQHSIDPSVDTKTEPLRQVDDAIYPLNVCDAEGKPVMAEHKYVLYFNKDELPPVDAFWSLTLYDAEGFQVANPLNRFAIGDRDSLRFNADGSLDLYVQSESPGSEEESNWLPAPRSGTLGLTLRLYAPKPQVANGLWNPPAIRRIE